MEDRCDWTKCKELVFIGYLGKGMCKDHWVKFCELQDNGHENQARNKIGLPPRKNLVQEPKYNQERISAAISAIIEDIHVEETPATETEVENTISEAKTNPNTSVPELSPIPRIKRKRKKKF